MGRTILHIVAACDANLMVVKLLAYTNPTTCNILDEDSHTLLYLTCYILYSPSQDEEDKSLQL